MNKNLVFIVLFLGNTTLYSQSQWAIGNDYLMQNGQDVFISGVNYLPSKDWHFALKTQNLSLFESDFKAMHDLGIETIRFFPLWPLLQPNADQLDLEMLVKLGKILDLADKYQLSVQLAPLTGWMSGGSFLPDWARGDIFRDPDIIKGEEFLVREIARRFNGHPALQAYDFGNELNVFAEMGNFTFLPDETDQWMQSIYNAFREGDKEVILTNGIGTGYVPEFDTRLVAKYADFMSPHSYPYFNRTNRLDPTIGLRTTYSGNYSVCWAQMEGKPTIMQEIGKGDNAVPISLVADFLTITFLSNWADGAAGYLWWCSHNVDRVFSFPPESIHLPYSFGYGLSDYKVGYTDSNMGLLKTDNTPKLTGIAYKDCAEIIKQLGTGWKDNLPVCYLVIPDSADFNPSLVKFINPYVLLKQNHVDVKMIRESQTVPGDADAVLICDFQLSRMGRKSIGIYLRNGGTVYQSNFNDFSDSIQFMGKSDSLVNPLIWTNSMMGMKPSGEYINTVALWVKEIHTGRGVRNLGLLLTGDESPTQWEFGKPVFCHTSIGEGRYFFLSANLESALTNAYNPWENDESFIFYSCLFDPQKITIDSKFVEYYLKTKEGKNLLILINHSTNFQDVAIRSEKEISMISIDQVENITVKDVHYVRMKPAEYKLYFYE